MAWQRSLMNNANTILTTLKRVRKLVGDRAMEASKMKPNNLNSYGTMLLHWSKK